MKVVFGTKYVFIPFIGKKGFIGRLFFLKKGKNKGIKNASTSCVIRTFLSPFFPVFFDASARLQLAFYFF